MQADSLPYEPPEKPQKNQFSLVTQSCLILCDPMDCSTPGFPVHQQLLEFAQTHVHWIGDALQPSHPLLSPSPSFSPSQPSVSFLRSQFFASGGQSTGVSASAPVLPMNIHDWFPLGLAGLISLQSKGLWKSFLQHHSSKGLTLRCCFLYGPTLTSMHDYWKNHSFD